MSPLKNVANQVWLRFCLSAAAGVSAFAWLLNAAVYAQTQGWKPTQPVEIVIGRKSGGGQDRWAIAVKEGLESLQLVGVPVELVYVPGAGGAKAVEYINGKGADGHHLVINQLTQHQAHIIGESRIGPNDYTPVALMLSEYFMISVPEGGPLRSENDIAARLKPAPDALSVSIGSRAGNASHITFAQVMRSLGVDIRKLKLVTADSAKESLLKVTEGGVDIYSSAVSNALPALRDGKLRALGVGAPQRLGGVLAEVPTWRERGIENAFEGWRGLAGPKGMTPAQLAFWDHALARVAASAEWKAFLGKYHLHGSFSPSAEAARQTDVHYRELKSILVDLGLAHP